MKVVLMVNSECNMKCTDCYIPYKGHRDPEETLETVMELQDKGISVIIAGSETLLNRDYLKSYKQTGQGYLLTNGVLLHGDESLYDQLREHEIEKIALSMHFGIEKIIKSFPEKKVAKVLEEANKRGFITQISTTITSMNYKMIEEMCKKASGYGADILHFNRFIRLGRGLNLPKLSINQEQVEEFFRQVTEMRKIYPKSTLEIDLQGSLGPRTGSKGEIMARENSYCPAGRDLIAIDPHNYVYGCPLTMNSCIGRYENNRIVIERDLLEGRRDTCIANLIN